MNNIYIVDTNFFIQAHKAYYPLDVVPSFWNKIKFLAKEEKIVSIDKVQNEIYKNNDDLTKWCKDNLPQYFFKSTSNIFQSYQKVIFWAESRKNHYTSAALAEFLDADEADAFLIAYTLTNNSKRIVVTQEISEPNAKRKVKIPDACLALNVRFVNVMDMFRQLKETF